MLTFHEIPFTIFLRVFEKTGHLLFINLEKLFHWDIYGYWKWEIKSQEKEIWLDLVLASQQIL